LPSGSALTSPPKLSPKIFISRPEGASAPTATLPLLRLYLVKLHIRHIKNNFGNGASVQLIGYYAEKPRVALSRYH